NSTTKFETVDRFRDIAIVLSRINELQKVITDNPLLNRIVAQSPKDIMMALTTGEMNTYSEKFSRTASPISNFPVNSVARSMAETEAFLRSEEKKYAKGKADALPKSAYIELASNQFPNKTIEIPTLIEHVAEAATDSAKANVLLDNMATEALKALSTSAIDASVALRSINGGSISNTNTPVISSGGGSNLNAPKMIGQDAWSEIRYRMAHKWEYDMVREEEIRVYARQLADSAVVKIERSINMLWTDFSNAIKERVQKSIRANVMDAADNVRLIGDGNLWPLRRAEKAAKRSAKYEASLDSSHPFNDILNAEEDARLNSGEEINRLAQEKLNAYSKYERYGSQLRITDARKQADFSPFSNYENIKNYSNLPTHYEGGSNKYDEKFGNVGRSAGVFVGLNQYDKIKQKMINAAELINRVITTGDMSKPELISEVEAMKEAMQRLDTERLLLAQKLIKTVDNDKIVLNGLSSNYKQAYSSMKGDFLGAKMENDMKRAENMVEVLNAVGGDNLKNAKGVDALTMRNRIFKGNINMNNLSEIGQVIDNAEMYGKLKHTDMFGNESTLSSGFDIFNTSKKSGETKASGQTAHFADNLLRYMRSRRDTYDRAIAEYGLEGIKENPFEKGTAELESGILGSDGKMKTSDKMREYFQSKDFKQIFLGRLQSNVSAFDKELQGSLQKMFGSDWKKIYAFIDDNATLLQKGGIYGQGTGATNLYHSIGPKGQGATGDILTGTSYDWGKGTSVEYAPGTEYDWLRNKFLRPKQDTSKGKMPYDTFSGQMNAASTYEGALQNFGIRAKQIFNDIPDLMQTMNLSFTKAAFAFSRVAYGMRVMSMELMALKGMFAYTFKTALNYAEKYSETI
ncbi:MAG: hypothetical protein PHX51_08665, partial [Clostridia bacterium]|nr:hypothetical protein [Clostridia bacterium]